jgi:hypothetical protein
MWADKDGRAKHQHQHDVESLFDSDRARATLILAAIILSAQAPPK